jgi:hypothetical protein
MDTGVSQLPPAGRFPAVQNGMAKKETHQLNLNPKKLWTAEEIDRRLQEDDQPCNSGIAQ